MLAIAGGKGGSGKTTTTACLARGLAGEGPPPIAVDGDCDMPDLHLVAGTCPRPGIGAYEDGASLDEVTHSAVELPGVEVLPAGRGGVGALEATLEQLAATPRPVVVDTPAGASPVVATALRAADAVVVVSTATPESLEDAAKTAAMARTLGTRVLGAVVTRSAGQIEPEPLLGCQTLAHVPDVTAPLTDGTVAARYDRVVDEVVERNI
ncbi:MULTISPECIES: MinD/ParA family ATP-binding protein [Halomicrobium]|uniref:Cobyrinic acid ac-diamide synthase n=2 Tax=Halomicrobium mukohataei TaxID=57705 RepID=C7NXH8_HALMD|nr:MULTISPECIES: division plane positioning ATPase MipZ [Halomicrobium]ACV48412.1 Cobyrinic acid ac-diamide synthase [Halomicrobium mukohataei DSM 12286]QCD66820.1 cobyrinic acid ac-diamide synthase [Halomicrobium mukohataei]QFR21630.1 cobyrinic acid ac-diamide synthase [Halomicrobium sp. ZPS1]